MIFSNLTFYKLNRMSQIILRNKQRNYRYCQVSPEDI